MINMILNEFLNNNKKNIYLYKGITYFMTVFIIIFSFSCIFYLTKYFMTSVLKYETEICISGPKGLKNIQLFNSIKIINFGELINFIFWEKYLVK